MLIKFAIHNHSGTLIDTIEANLDIVPRVGEIVALPEMDNTDEFIVTDIVHYPIDNFIEVTCESFYRQNGHPRHFYLRQAEWLPPCIDSCE